MIDRTNRITHLVAELGGQERVADALAPGGAAQAPYAELREAIETLLTTYEGNVEGEYGGTKALGERLAISQAVRALLPNLGRDPNAARYIAWRDAMLADDKKFDANMAAALPAEVGVTRRPTAEEWDAAVDKAAALPAEAADFAQGDRTVVLLTAAHALLKKQAGTSEALNLLYEEVHYDGTNCDGICLISDIEDELGIDGEARPA